MAEKIIGIDLGTSNSAASVIQGGKPVLIPAAEGTTAAGKAFPSIVAFSKDGELLVGEPARRQAVTNPDNTVREAKRKMGTDFLYKIQGKDYKPQQISAFILQKIKRDSEAFTGETINKAVITVPAYFDDNQRQATKDAGIIAGLEVVRIINEPTAASLAFGIDKSKEDMKILVFDFGGGTLDVTIMEMGGGVFEVMSTSGDTQLGGSDMDKAIIDYVVDDFRKKDGIDLSNDSTAMTRIKEGAEKAKIELSTVMETEINLPFIAQDSSGSKNLEVKLTMEKLDDLVDSPISNFDAAVHTVEHLLRLAGVTVVGMTSEDIGGIYRSGREEYITACQQDLHKDPEHRQFPLQKGTIFIYDDSGDGESGVTEAIYKKIEETFRRALDMVSHCIGNCKEEAGCSKCTFLIRQCSQWNENLNKPGAIRILDEIVHSFPYSRTLHAG